MTAAATAALPLEGLPNLPCTLPIDRAVSEIHAPTGHRSVRRCVLPAGHETRDVPCDIRVFDEWTRPDVNGEEIF